MRTFLRKWLLAILLVSLLGGPAWAQAQGRLATIDLRKVFDGYWKKKQAEAALNERKAGMEKDDKDMRDEYKKANDEYQTLLKSAQDQNAAPEERDRRKKAAEDKLKDLKEKEDTLTAFERQARATIAEQSQRMRNNILSEIRTVVEAKARTDGLSMVIDTAAQSVNDTPIILFTNHENDITDSVLAQLNAAAPADFSTSGDSTGGKSGDSTGGNTEGKK